MDVNELNKLEYRACVRLSDIGYKRYQRFMRQVSATSVKDPAKALSDFIDAWEAREMRLSMMVKVAPMYANIAITS